MHLSPAILERTYDYLSANKPISDWGLPPAEEVEFHVIGKRKKDPLLWGDHDEKDGRHVIRIVGARHKNMMQVMMTMAHEMGHVAQRRTDRKDRPSAGHGPKFMRLMKAVGRVYGWDPKII